MIASTIILTTFNRKSVVATYTSCAEQIYHRYDIIVVDDGNTIPIQEILSSSLEVDHIKNRLMSTKFINLPHSGNIGLLRNIGLAYTNTPYVCFCSDDAILDPLYLEIMINEIQSGHYNYDIVFCPTKVIEENKDNINITIKDEDEESRILLASNTYQPLYSGCFLARTDLLLSNPWTLNINDSYPTNTLISNMLRNSAIRINSRIEKPLYIHTNTENMNRNMVKKKTDTLLYTHS